jgi:hypothetical protein
MRRCGAQEFTPLRDTLPLGSPGGQPQWSCIRIAMAIPSKKYVPRRSGLMDFEPVSIDSARAALDELPAGMALQLSNQYWEKVRRAPLATDRLLTGKAMGWVSELPEELRPRATVERYARIVNALATAWPNEEARDSMFEHLLNDRRVGRRGFPIDVERELSALCLYASTLPKR